MAIPFIPLAPDAFPEAARPSIERLNVFLLELSRYQGTVGQPLQSRRSDASVARRDTVQVDVSRITPSISSVVSGVSTVVATPALTFGLTNTVGTSTSAVSINSAIALFNTSAPPAVDASAGVAGLSSTAANLGHRHQVSTAIPTIGYTTTAGLTGSAVTLVRSDATLLAPTFLRASADESTVALTGDITDQTLTGSLGALNLRPAAGTLSLPKWTGGGANIAAEGRVLSFAALTGTIGTTLNHGIFASVAYNTAAAYTSLTHRGAEVQVTQTSTAPTYTNETVQVLRLQYDTGSLGAGPNTFTEVDGISLVFEPPIGAGTTITDSYGYRLLGWPSLGTGGTYTNVACERLMLPTMGATIRRGVWVDSSSTANLGTEAANVEGFYCSDIPRGTAQRTSFYAEGAGTGTPTNVMSFYAASHAVGTSRYAFYGVSDTLYHGGDIRHAGSRIGLYNVGSGATQSTGWSVSNITTTKTLNGSSFTLNDVMNVLGTLLTYLQVRGDIAA